MGDSRGAATENIIARNRADPLLGRVFFFQAEDGIRDADVTGVQTCALPISNRGSATSTPITSCVSTRSDSSRSSWPVRSEERRVGKECRSRWAAYPLKKEEKSCNGHDVAAAAQEYTTTARSGPALRPLIIFT